MLRGDHIEQLGSADPTVRSDAMRAIVAQGEIDILLASASSGEILSADGSISDDVTLATMDPMKPAVLRGVGRDDYLYLLMPVRVP